VSHVCVREMLADTVGECPPREVGGVMWPARV